MKKLSFFLLLAAALPLQAATVYTRINNTPADGWAGNEGQYPSQKYLIVYELSDTKALVWDGTDDNYNHVEATISNGQILSEDLADYQITVTQEKSKIYYVKAKDGYIGCAAKSNGITFSNGGKECTITQNGSYTMLETNTNTCRFICYQNSVDSYRFRFYYDKDKKWDNTKYKNIHFYVLGDVEQEEPQNQLDINYAHAEMYACESKFPTQNNTVDQYFLTELFLAQEESYEAVPQVTLEILAPTQYSIEGTYKSDYTPGKKYFLNCQAGAKHSYFIFPSKAEQGWSEASIKVAELKVTKVGKSQYPNAYVYHVHLEFTDSNKKNWSLDKDLDIYAWWIDCDRSDKDNLQDMEPVAFALESGNHQTEEMSMSVESVSASAAAVKVFRDGQLLILRDGNTYNAQGLILE